VRRTPALGLNAAVIVPTPYTATQIRKTFFLPYISPSLAPISIVNAGTVYFSSEIAISLNFTAEHTENAEAPKTQVIAGMVIKLCVLGDLRVDKSLAF
jgi:hypothetical protein